MGTFVDLVYTVATLAMLAQSTVAQGANTTLPLTYPGRVLPEGSSQTCPSEEQQGRSINEVKTAERRLLRESVIPRLQAFSCGGSNDWRRVAYLNMSDPSQQCPSVWQEITTQHRVCGRKSTRASCEGLTYSTGGEQYDQVCGRIIGYQLGTSDAFQYGASRSINSDYLDGVSVTHGYPRQHIWSFACGLDEGNTVYPAFTCPCVTGSTANIPSFVGQNYFCESGITRWNGSIIGTFWPNGDPLWDGWGCGPTSTCCTFNSPPWFNVQLSSPTTDDIEVRICSDQEIGNEDTPIQLIELFVK